MKINSNPNPQDISFLEDQINEFNFDTTGITDGELLSILIRDQQNELMAGLYGWTWGGTCEIRFLWVRAGERGHGLGREMLQAAEAEAHRRGCFQMVLSTHSFQAPAFYRKLGYEITGGYQDYPKGHQMYYLHKGLSNG
jgi:GNAT superfamily N-acetyltransferase